MSSKDTARLTKEEIQFLTAHQYDHNVLEFLQAYVDQFKDISIIESTDLNEMAKAYIAKGVHIPAEKRYSARIKGTRHYIVLETDAETLKKHTTISGVPVGKGLTKIEWKSLLDEYGINHDIEELIFEEI